MQVDTMKLLFTYILALVIVVGGGLMLFAIRLDPPESGSATLSLAIAGFMGGAITFVFGAEASTRATRAAQSTQRVTTESAVQAGVSGEVPPLTGDDRVVE